MPKDRCRTTSTSRFASTQSVSGTFKRPISSTNAEAQAYFNQGFQLMYAFARVGGRAIVSRSQKRDPNCAICYWGEAWVWGPYISEGRTPEHEVRAYAAIQKAVALAGAHASIQREQAFIQAMETCATPVASMPSDRRTKTARTQRRWARVARTYPDDLDAATLYAEALFLLLPRPGAFDIKDPDVARVLSVLEAALKRDIRHPVRVTCTCTRQS